MWPGVCLRVKRPNHFIRWASSSVISCGSPELGIALDVGQGIESVFFELSRSNLLRRVFLAGFCASAGMQGSLMRAAPPWNRARASRNDFRELPRVLA